MSKVSSREKRIPIVCGILLFLFRFTAHASPFFDLSQSSERPESRRQSSAQPEVDLQAMGLRIKLREPNTHFAGCSLRRSNTGGAGPMNSEYRDLVAETRELIDHTRQEISQLREELRSAWNAVGQSQRLLSRVERRRRSLLQSSNSKRRRSERGTHEASLSVGAWKRSILCPRRRPPPWAIGNIGGPDAPVSRRGCADASV